MIICIIIFTSCLSSTKTPTKTPSEVASVKPSPIVTPTPSPSVVPSPSPSVTPSPTPSTEPVATIEPIQLASTDLDSIDNDKNETVYIGKTGTKYHTSYCRTLKGTKIETTLKKAKAQGKTACAVCH